MRGLNRTETSNKQSLIYPINKKGLNWLPSGTQYELIRFLLKTTLNLGERKRGASKKSEFKVVYAISTSID